MIARVIELFFDTHRNREKEKRKRDKREKQRHVHSVPIKSLGRMNLRMDSSVNVNQLATEMCRQRNVCEKLKKKIKKKKGSKKPVKTMETNETTSLTMNELSKKWEIPMIVSSPKLLSSPIYIYYV